MKTNSKILQLKDGLELFILPLPIQDTDKISYYQESKQVWINNSNLRIKKGRYFFKNDNIFDETAYMALKNHYLKNRMKNNSVDNLSFANKYYSYVLYDNELKIIYYGHKIKNIVDNEEDIYDKFYYFKKLMIKIKKIGQFNNYDETYFSEKYHNIDYKNSNGIFKKLKQDRTLDKVFKRSSFNNNQKDVFELFDTLELMDLRIYMRRKKLDKIIKNIV